MIYIRCIYLFQKLKLSVFAVSDDLPGLLAQGRAFPETIEMAQDIAWKLLESYLERGGPLP